MVHVPIIGVQVVAGEPILPVKTLKITGRFPPIVCRINRHFFKGKRRKWAINAGILDGDMVLVEEDSTASNGDMVVALGSRTEQTKTFYKEEEGEFFVSKA